LASTFNSTSKVALGRGVWVMRELSIARRQAPLSFADFETAQPRYVFRCAPAVSADQPSGVGHDLRLLSQSHKMDGDTEQPGGFGNRAYILPGRLDY
jgi:hypothetical protein